MSPDQQLMLLYLYEEEIIKRIAVNHAEAGNFAQLLSLGEYEMLVKQYNFNWTTFASKLWEHLWKAPTRDLLYPVVLNFLLTCDKRLHRRLISFDCSSGLFSFEAVLQNCRKFIEIMDPAIISEHISKVSEHHAQLMAPVKSISERSGEISAKKYILRTIPDLGEGAFLDFLNAIAACSDVGREFVADTYPHFERYYCLFLHERGKVERGKLYFCQPEIPIADVIMESKSNKVKKEHMVDLRYQRFPLNDCDVAGEDLYEGEVIVLREYQEELANPAYNDENTLICAPTGTGKTVVAASIVRHHLSVGRRKNLHTKVCFFVANTTFLDQQAKVLEKFVGHRWKVVFLSGVTISTPVAETIQAYDVIVITPQLIVNLLTMCNKDCSSLFSLSSFSLMIFDEAHHTDANHPYNVIMGYYHDMKYVGRIKDGERLPQIVGLTASMGIGNAQNDSEAVEHFIKMCANLDITALSYVKEHIDELDLYTSIAVDETKLVASNLTIDPVAVGITDLMRRFERILYYISSTSSSGLSDSSNSLHDLLCKLQKPPHEKCSKAYETWFSQLFVKIVPESKLEREERLRIMMCLQIIEILYRTLEQYVHFPFHVAKKYFEDECNALELSINQEFLDILQTCPLKTIVESASHNELYEELLRLLHAEFTKQRDGRAIVFVQTRDFAGRLSEQLNEDKSLKELGVRSDIVTGVNAAGDVGGQSISEQRETLAQFADGNIKILCATSVAEEGIDIQKCNLVIKYNYVTNEIAHIQRRGRSRAADSRCILLTCDPKLQAREEKNIIRERIMRNALRLIGQKSPNWLREEVAKYVRKNTEERLIKIVVAGAKKDSLYTRNYKLLCKKCDAVICTSDDIVVTSAGTQYLCVCKEIWNRCKQFPYSKYALEREERYQLKGIGSVPFLNVEYYFSLIVLSLHIRCAICGHQWGRAVRCNAQTFPVIAAEAFVLVAENGERFQRRRWKQIVENFFKPRSIELYDYASTECALSEPFEGKSTT